MDNVIDLAERRKAKAAQTTPPADLIFDCAANDETEKPVTKTKEQIAQERKEHNERVLKNYRIK